MDARWLKGLTGEERERRKRDVESFQRAFNELADFLEDEFEESTPDYDNPSWSHKQADVNGANRKLKQILKLLRN